MRVYRRKNHIIAIFLVIVLLCCTACRSKNDAVQTQLLEYPGVHWNDTPDRVIDVLEISQEQILENQAVTDEADTVGEDWSLVVSGLKCLDTTSDQTQFVFTRYHGSGDYGLAYVKVTLPKDTDMQAMEAALTDHYGVSSTDTLPRYDLVDGTVEDITHQDLGELSYVGEAGEETPLNPGHGENTYWLAGVTGTAYLSEEQQQKVIDAYTHSEIASAPPESVTQWMELEPLAYILLSDNGNALARATGSDVSPNVLIFSGRQLLFLTQYFS